jgi:hypothetical protein
LLTARIIFAAIGREAGTFAEARKAIASVSPLTVSGLRQHSAPGAFRPAPDRNYFTVVADDRPTSQIILDPKITLSTEISKQLPFAPLVKRIAIRTGATLNLSVA